MAQPAHMEQTIAAPIEFTGVGLHSGAPVTMRLLPAPAGSGIVFRRTDLDNFEIAANGRNVAKVSYATSLMRQGVLISTTEHLLSALIGMGVDNVIVEIDNLDSRTGGLLDLSSIQIWTLEHLSIERSANGRV